MLKIRKCQWICKPDRLRILSSRSLTFMSTGEHHFVWTTDEDDRIVFGCEGDVQCGIALVFSIDQGLSIVNDHGHVSLDMDMLEIRTHQEWDGCDEDCSLTVERRGDSVMFLSAGRQLYSFTFPSIASSVSISFFCRGCGQVTFSFS